MSYTPVELVKNGKTRVASSLVEETRLRWDGWLPTGAVVRQPRSVRALLGDEVDAALGAAYEPKPTPSDVGSRGGKWDPAHSIYYPPGFSRLRKIKAKLGAVGSGTANSVCRIALVGHSAVSGYGSTVGVNGPAVALRKLLAARYPVGSGMAQTYNNNPGTPWDSRWSFSGTWNYNGSPPGGGDPQLYRASVAAGNTETFTSDVPGTVLDIYTFGNSGPFTYSVDGGSAVTVTPNGSSATQLVTVTGLANTTHTVVFTTTTTTSTAIIAAGVRPSIAVEVDSFGFYGAFADDFKTPSNFWNAAPAAKAFPADLYLIQLDGNEALAGTPVAPSVLQANLAAVIAAFQGTGADVAMITSANPNLDPTFWGTYRAAVYNVADSAAAPLVDLTDRIGPHAAAVTNGMHYSDQVHLSPPGYADAASAVAGLLL